MILKKIIMLICVTFGMLSLNAYAAVSGPYTPDDYTLHLYHFDGNADDAVSTNALHLSLQNGATAIETSYPDFGTALNTYEGTGTIDYMPTARIREQYISNFVGADGAFTFEAIVRPAVAIDVIPNHMQIIAGEDDGSSRGWQFRITTTGQLEFTKLTGTIETFSAALPTTGEHAWLVNGWFHVAVTYSGSENTADNLKLYWTYMDSGEAQAVLLESFQMSEDFQNPSIDFSIGNEDRNETNENFEGLVDEARISSIARQADDMIFVSGVPRPVFTDHPSDTTVRESETAIFQAIFISQSTPTVTWFKSDPSGDIELSSSDPDITTNVIYDTINEYYTATLWIANTSMSDKGQYYCQANNDSDLPRNSDTAELFVQGLIAHWTLDQDDFSNGQFIDIIGGYNADPVGTPVFADGADGIANSAVQITSDSGWADVNDFDPCLGTGVMSISIWANWHDEAIPSQDLQIEPYPDANSITVENGLWADSQWQHICAVYNGKTAKVYIDGILAAEGAWSLLENTEALLTIGYAADNGADSFNGQLDDLRIYNYPITDTEVAEIFFEMTGKKVCILEYADAFDYTGPDSQPDCIVDSYDLIAFSNQWLSLYDIEDFANLAQNWLSSGLFPE